MQVSAVAVDWKRSKMKGSRSSLFEMERRAIGVRGRTQETDETDYANTGRKSRLSGRIYSD